MSTRAEPETQFLVLDTNQVFFGLMALAQALVFGIIWLLFLGQNHPKHAEQLAYFLFFAAVPPLTLAGWVAAPRLLQWQGSKAFRTFLWILALAAAPTIVVCGLINIERLIYYSYEPAPRLAPFSTLRFAVGAGFGAALFAGLLLIETWWRRPPWSPSGMVAMWIVGAALILGLFDPYLMIDTLSYSPYVGPAFAMRNGAVPMVDTFSQYGPNFVMFAAAFAVAPTFYAASAIVTALNAVMAVTFVAIATQLARRPWFSFTAGVFIVWFLHSAFLYNVTYTPSVFAMRFLPPMLLVATLLRIPPERPLTPASATGMVLCSLWSFEAFTSALLIYAAWLIIRGIGERRPWSHVIRDTGFVGVLALAPHALLTLAYLAVFKTPPRYDIYLELVFSHMAGTYWLMPVEAGVRTWILFGFAYASALAYAGFRALTGASDMRRPAGIAAIAVLGVLEFYYYVGRSATPILLFIAMPLMLLVLLACDWAVDALRKQKSAGLPVLAAPTLGAALFLFVFMGGTLADRTFEPISRDLANATLLRACLPTGDAKICSVRRMAGLITGADVPRDQYPKTESGGSLSYTHTENQAEFELVQRFALERNRRVILLGTDPVPVIFHSSHAAAARIVYPPHVIGIVYPAVDGLSPTLRSRALASLNQVRAGDIIIRGKLPIYNLDQQVLSAIEAQWTLCPKEKLVTAQAFELTVPSEGACDAR